MSSWEGSLLRGPGLTEPGLGMANTDIARESGNRRLGGEGLYIQGWKLEGIIRGSNVISKLKIVSQSNLYVSGFNVSFKRVSVQMENT